MAKNTMYLYGKNPVLERLRVNPKSIRKIFLIDSFDDSRILDAIQKAGIKRESLPYKQLIKIKRADRLQGVIAQVEKFKYVPFEELLDKPPQERLTLIFLDNLMDPQNLGVIIRTVACLGGFAIVIPEHGSCKVTEAVLHVASGGENYVPVTVVGNTSKALMEAKRIGYWVAAAVVEGGEDIKDVKFLFPLCLVMGSEGKGIRPGLMKHLDFKITVPMRGATLSFNVAVATSLFSYEISKQRGARYVR